MKVRDCYVLSLLPTPIVSVVTGRKVYINTNQEFLVSPSFDATNLRDAARDWEAYITIRTEARSAAGHNGHQFNVGIDSGTALCLDRCFSATNVKQFAMSADALVCRLLRIEQDAADSETIGKGRSKKKAGRKAGESSRILEALVLFWRHKMLLFPAAELWKQRLIPTQSLPDIEYLHFGRIADFLSEMNEGTRPEQRRSIRLLPLTMEGLTEVGDIDEQVIGALKQFTPFISPSVAALCDRLHAAQRKAYGADPEKIAKIPQSYRAILKTSSRSRSDRTFTWATVIGGTRLKEWADCSSGYLDSETNRISLIGDISAVNTILDYVVEHPDIPPKPIDYCLRDFKPNASLVAYIEKRCHRGASIVLRVAFRLFTWTIQKYGSDSDAVTLRKYCNPIESEEISSHEPKLVESRAHKIPLRYMSMLREIIECPDTNGIPTYAWPKSIASDQVMFVDPATGKTEIIWSPVRAQYFLLRFTLPLRSLQTRLLDSGEADANVYRPEKGGWVPNTGPHAPLDPHKIPNGFIRKIWDPDHKRWFNGLYVTTNKNADRDESFSDPGYEIPWENPEIINPFCWLRDWQEHYNPCITPLSRAELLSDKGLIVSDDVTARLDKLCFLFRDPGHSAYPQEPISPGRLQMYWLLLLAELETRLEKSGEKNLDGSRIQIIEEWRTPKKGKPRPDKAIFEPHSLRVTGITSLLDAGVPLQIVSRCVAGHSNLRITLYYNKPGAEKVTKILDEAWQRFATLELADWDAYLKDKTFELIHDLAAYNSEEGLQAARETQSAFWTTLDEGICPNGGTQCDKGGPLLSKSQNIYAPVPGGHRNCALCRFFVTGPAFVGGLAAKCNSTYALLKERLLRKKEAEAKRRSFATESLNNGHSDSFSTRRRIALADEVVQSAETEVELFTRTWFALVSLVQRVKTIIQRHPKHTEDGTLALMLNCGAEDFQIAMQDCTDYELWDQICQSAVFYPGIDASISSIRRAQLYDAILSHDGRPAFFATLTDVELVEVGNAMSSFLRTKLGDAVTNDLIDGRQTIRELGILDELSALLANSRTVRLSSEKPVRSQALAESPILERQSAQKLSRGN